MNNKIFPTLFRSRTAMPGGLWATCWTWPTWSQPNSHYPRLSLTPPTSASWLSSPWSWLLWPSQACSSIASLRISGKRRYSRSSWNLLSGVRKQLAQGVCSSLQGSPESPSLLFRDSLDQHEASEAFADAFPWGHSAARTSWWYSLVFSSYLLSSLSSVLLIMTFTVCASKKNNINFVSKN